MGLGNTCAVLGVVLLFGGGLLVLVAHPQQPSQVFTWYTSSSSNSGGGSGSSAAIDLDFVAWCGESFWRWCTARFKDLAEATLCESAVPEPQRAIDDCGTDFGTVDRATHAVRVYLPYRFTLQHTSGEYSSAIPLPVYLMHSLADAQFSQYYLPIIKGLTNTTFFKVRSDF